MLKLVKKKRGNNQKADKVKRKQKARNGRNRKQEMVEMILT